MFGGVGVARKLIMPLAVLSAACTLGAQVPGEIRGRVFDAHTTHAVSGASIELGGRTDITRSGADGEFVVRGLDPREYQVRVRALGYIARTTSAKVVNGRPVSLDIALDPSLVTLTSVDVRAARDTQAPHAVTFDRNAIEKSGRRDIGELLQSTPGVVVTQAGGAGAATHVSIRGSSASEVLVLLDGVPLNSSVNGTADLSHISLESIERITVLTGAQSARYGARAMAGVIEIETRHSMDEQSLLLRTGAWGEHEASLSASSSQAIGAKRLNTSITGDYRDTRGDFSFLLPAFRGGGSATRVNSDMTARQLLGGLSIDDANGSEGMRASWEKLSRGLAGSIVQPSMTGRESNERISAGVDARRKTGVLTWTALADISHETETFTDPAPPFGTAYHDTVSATGVAASGTASAGGAAIGTELRTLDVKSTMLSANAPHWQRILGAFGSYRASRPLSKNIVASADAAARVDNSSLDGSTAFSPRIGASVARGAVIASASAGNGFSPPTLADQFFHEGVQVRANPSLKPERTKGDVEGRLTLRAADVGPLLVSATAAAFRADIDGMILWFPDFQFVWSPSNFNVHRRGYELSATTSAPSANVELQGTFNHTDVTYTGAVLSGQVTYRPQVTGSVTAAYAPRVGRFEISNRYVGERRTVPGSALNTLDPYWITDARWMSQFNRGAVSFELMLGIENVLDRPAAMLVDYPFPGRTWTVSLRARHSPSI